MCKLTSRQDAPHVASPLPQTCQLSPLYPWSLRPCVQSVPTYSLRPWAVPPSRQSRPSLSRRWAALWPRYAAPTVAVVKRNLWKLSCVAWWVLQPAWITWRACTRAGCLGCDSVLISWPFFYKMRSLCSFKYKTRLQFIVSIGVCT